MPEITPEQQLIVLEARLRDPTCTVQEFKDYASLAHQLAPPPWGDAQPLQLVNLDWYVNDAALLTFWQAVDWWPRNHARTPVPTLVEFAAGARQYPNGEPLTFDDLLTMRANAAIRFLVADGINVVNPNETKEERAARLNRERVKRHRQAHKRVEAGVEENPDLIAARQELLMLKGEAEEVRDKLSAKVTEHHQAMLAASGERKRVDALYAERIRAAKDRIDQLEDT